MINTDIKVGHKVKLVQMPTGLIKRRDQTIDLTLGAVYLVFESDWSHITIEDDKGSPVSLYRGRFEKVEAPND
jgi:hypothetical protein